MKLFTLLFLFAATVFGQQIAVLGGYNDNTRVSAKVYAPVTSRVSIGTQYRFSNNDAAALVSFDVIRARKLTIAAEAGYGLTREIDTDIRWQLGRIPVYAGNRLIYVDAVVGAELYKRTPWLGTAIAGAIVSYRLSKHVSIQANYQFHAVNRHDNRHVTQVGVAIDF